MKALVFGSMNIDCVYQQDHIVCPGETLSSLSFARNAGGKGLNQAIALAKAGMETWFAGNIGEDGLFLKALLEQNGIRTDMIRIGETPTGCAIIQVDKNGQNAIVLYGGANQTVTEEQIRETLANFGPGDLLLMQNEINLGRELLAAARAAGITVAVNPSPISPELTRWPLETADWLILNEIEGAALGTEGTPVVMYEALEKKYPDTRIVLTLGEDGSMARDGDHLVRQASVRVPVVDTTAAGDTFTGFFLHAVMNGTDITSALNRAARAAAITVSRPGAGASIPTRDEVD
ncbi:MAG: ribokinase [Clostridia bacterium]|nr:ribokinase [Clostridia bacterium]